MTCNILIFFCILLFVFFVIWEEKKMVKQDRIKIGQRERTKIDRLVDLAVFIHTN